MITFIIGTAAITILSFIWVLIQFGLLAAMFLAGFVAIVLAALIGAVIWLITWGREFFTRKQQGHFG